jgi:hypothetical protein
MGRRSRKGHAPGAAPAARPPRRSSEERNQEVRDQLEPLAPGERPFWVGVAAAVAALMGLLTLVLVAAGSDVTGSDDTPVTGVAQAVVLLLAAGGMWLSKYWAVLGFQALLAITMVYGFVSLLFAGNVLGVIFGLAVVAGSTFLFWKLIRAMARIQMPRRP